MHMHTKVIAALVLLLLVSVLSVGAPELTITGRVIDSSARPIPDATVMVYHAGVLNGYSTFCPSCYRDCGKRTKTDSAGNYVISKLDSGLWFDLLVVRDGYAPEIIKVKDPSVGTVPLTTLKARLPAPDPSHVVKGHVVDENGRAVPGAVVTSVGVEEDYPMIGTISGLDPLAVTNQNGDFEVFYEKSAKRMLVTVEARTLALRYATLVTGPQRQTIVLSKGGAVKGRLVQEGKPVGDAEIGLIGQRESGWGPALTIVGDPYPEMRVGTKQDGTFLISDVPVGVQWFVYPKMESVALRGASEPKVCSTAKPGEIVNIGDIQLSHGYRLQGKVTVNDGKAIPDGMRVMIYSERVWGKDSQTALLDKDGRFVFVGLPKGEYLISPAVRGYRVASDKHGTRVAVERDIDDFAISLSPKQPTQ
jgi:Carboxypeptidase regulatory-like domain